MLSAIISTHESERSLVPTLAALVPGAAAGLLADVVVADANSRDATAEVADIAGCRYLSSSDPLGARLKAAAATTRTGESPAGGHGTAGRSQIQFRDECLALSSPWRGASVQKVTIGAEELARRRKD